VNDLQVIAITILVVAIALGWAIASWRARL